MDRTSSVHPLLSGDDVKLEDPTLEEGEIAGITAGIEHIGDARGTLEALLQNEGKENRSDNAEDNRPDHAGDGKPDHAGEGKPDHAEDNKPDHAGDGKPDHAQGDESEEDETDESAEVEDDESENGEPAETDEPEDAEGDESEDDGPGEPEDGENDESEDGEPAEVDEPAATEDDEPGEPEDVEDDESADAEPAEGEDDEPAATEDDEPADVEDDEPATTEDDEPGEPENDEGDESAETDEPVETEDVEDSESETDESAEADEPAATEDDEPADVEDDEPADVEDDDSENGEPAEVEDDEPAATEDDEPGEPEDSEGDESEDGESTETDEPVETEDETDEPAEVEDDDSENGEPAETDEPEEADDETDGETGEPLLTVTRSETERGVTMTVRNATAGSTAAVDLGRSGPPPADPITLTAFGIRLAADRGVLNVTVTGPAATHDDFPTVREERLVGYVGLDADLDDEAVGTAVLEFQVNETALPVGVEPDELDLYQYADGEVQALEVTDTATEGRYRVAVSSLAPVAIVAPEPGRIEVVDAMVPADWVQQGYTATVRATVENPSDRTAIRSLVVTVDGESVANETVTLSPGERDVVDIEFEAIGGTVAVEGVEAGVLEVGPPRLGESDSLAADDDGAGFSLQLVALLLLALALVGRMARVVVE